MTDSMNFGPEWLRNLSSDGNISSSSSTPKYQLSDYRYGREDMLALFTKTLKPPESLVNFSVLYAEQIQTPLALAPMTEDESRLWQTRPPSTLSSRGRGISLERSRGRGRGTSTFYQGYSRSSSLYDESSSRAYTTPWPERNGGEPTDWGASINSPRKETISRGGTSVDNWRRNRLDDDGDGWRANNSSHRSLTASEKWGRSTGTSWRNTDGDLDDGYERVSDRMPEKGGPPGSRGSWHSSIRDTRDTYHSIQSSGGGRTSGGSSVIRRNRDTWESGERPPPSSSYYHPSNGGDDLPEWATEETGGSGSFDSSGAFLRDDENNMNSLSSSNRSSSQQDLSSFDKNSGAKGDNQIQTSQSMHSIRSKMIDGDDRSIKTAKDRPTNENDKKKGKNEMDKKKETKQQKTYEENNETFVVDVCTTELLDKKKDERNNNKKLENKQTRGVRLNEKEGVNKTDKKSDNKNNNDNNLNDKSKNDKKLKNKENNSNSSGNKTKELSNSVTNKDHDTDIINKNEAVIDRMQEVADDLVAKLMLDEESTSTKKNEKKLEDNNGYLNNNGPQQQQQTILSMNHPPLIKNNQVNNSNENTNSLTSLFQNHSNNNNQQLMSGPPPPASSSANQQIDESILSNHQLLNSHQSSSSSPGQILQNVDQAQLNNWFYCDPQGDVQGPFASNDMAEWFKTGYFALNLLVKRQCDERFYPLGELIKFCGNEGDPFSTSTRLLPAMKNVPPNSELNQQNRNLNFEMVHATAGLSNLANVQNDFGINHQPNTTTSTNPATSGGAGASFEQMQHFNQMLREAVAIKQLSRTAPWPHLSHLQQQDLITQHILAQSQILPDVNQFLPTPNSHLQQQATNNHLMQLLNQMPSPNLIKNKLNLHESSDLESSNSTTGNTPENPALQQFINDMNAAARAGQTSIAAAPLKRVGENHHHHQRTPLSPTPHHLHLITPHLSSAQSAAPTNIQTTPQSLYNIIEPSHNANVPPPHHMLNHHEINSPINRLPEAASTNESSSSADNNVIKKFLRQFQQQQQQQPTTNQQPSGVIHGTQQSRTIDSFWPPTPPPPPTVNSGFPNSHTNQNTIPWLQHTANTPENNNLIAGRGDALLQQQFSSTETNKLINNTSVLSNFHQPSVQQQHVIGQSQAMVPPTPSLWTPDDQNVQNILQQKNNQINLEMDNLQNNKKPMPPSVQTQQQIDTKKQETKMNKKQEEKKQNEDKNKLVQEQKPSSAKQKLKSDEDKKDKSNNQKSAKKTNEQLATTPLVEPTTQNEKKKESKKETSDKNSVNKEQKDTKTNKSKQNVDVVTSTRKNTQSPADDQSQQKRSNKQIVEENLSKNKTVDHQAKKEAEEKRLRELEEKRRAKELRKQMDEENLKRKVEEKPLVDEKKKKDEKQIQEEQSRKQAEALKKMQDVQQRTRTATSTAPWCTPPITNVPAAIPTAKPQVPPQLSLAEIQKAEREKKAVELAIQQQQLKERMLKEQLEQQAAAEKANMQKKWAATVAMQPTNKVKSLAEIQAEEQERQAKLLAEMRSNQVKEKKEIVNLAQPTSIWSGASQSLTWGSNSGGTSWEDSNTSSVIVSSKLTTQIKNTGVISKSTSAVIVNKQLATKTKSAIVVSNATGVTAVSSSSNASSTKPKSIKPMTTAIVNNNNSKKPNSATQNLTKGISSNNNEDVLKLCDSNGLDLGQDFSKWCTKTLTSIDGEVHIPTFIGFLLDIESPYEVKDIVRTYLGETNQANEFAKQFLERRSRAKSRQKQSRNNNMSMDDDICIPAPAINPSSTEFQEVKSKNKKVKKSKMTKLDARCLGFSVTAAQDRLNIGDRDYGDTA